MMLKLFFLNAFFFLLGRRNNLFCNLQLKDKLKTYEVENFDDLILADDSNNPGMNRGYALLEFSARPEAMDAFRRLQKRDVVFGVDRSAKVSFADSYPEVDDEMMAQVSTYSAVILWLW
jgi:hypothetical protein